MGVVRPSPENDKLYRPVDPQAPDIRALAESIRVHGIKEPLVLTLDHYILSGHRRYASAKLAGLRSVPCRLEDMYRDDDLDGFVVLLREYNRQREKSLDEKLREEIVSVNAEESYLALTEYRHGKAQVDVETIDIPDAKRRAAISRAKMPMLKAVQDVIASMRRFWPLSDRMIHYRVLNDPPLRHASKPKSRYRNDRQSYKDLTDLLTRARLTGDIPMGAIADSTRPVFTWDVWHDTQDFIRREFQGFLRDYYRDLMVSQPVHIEILGEKNTLKPILQPIAADYTIPLSLGRGYCSLPPRAQLAQRFQKSGKDKLVLLLVSDFDPDGEVIAQSFARSMRDDFGISNVSAIKVALTAKQVEEMELPPGEKAKPKSKNYRAFVESFGDNVYELEALEPEQLQGFLRNCIDSVIDVRLFNAEIDKEREDSAHLEMVKRRVMRAIDGIVEAN
jgi:hypothetical protein